MKQFIPGIRQIHMIDAAKLTPSIRYAESTGIPIAIFDKGREIPLLLPGKLTCKTEMTDNAYFETVELEFRCFPGSFVIPNHPVAFVATTAVGESWLIGAREAPFPRIAKTDNTGEPDGTPYSTDVTISYTSAKSMIRVVF